VTDRRNKYISKQFFVSFANLANHQHFNFKNFQTKIYHKQISILQFIKRRPTVHLVHILRNYSALAVVVSSVLLVAATNASNREDCTFLFGYWKEGESSAFQTNTINSRKLGEKDNLALVNLAHASATIDPEASNKENDIVVGGENENLQFFASANNGTRKDPEEDGGVEIYEVKNGDTLSSIALAHKIDVKTILWANDIDDENSIMPGDKIFILPISGLSYTIQKGDNLDAIAKKYKSDKEKIIVYNQLPANGEVKEGQEIIIPDGYKEEPIQTQNDNSSTLKRRQYATSTGGKPQEISGWKNLEGKAGTGHNFPYGYCTWYVAHKRYIPWGGNAGTWLYHAKSIGYKTGKTPQKGAIMVSSESWWGHVAIVEKVSGDMITVSEMNYKKWAKVSTRVLSSKSRVIKGFIY